MSAAWVGPIFWVGGGPPSRDELENMRIRFDRLRVIMPSGLEINYPENCDLPSLDIKQAFSNGLGHVQCADRSAALAERTRQYMNPSQQSDSRVKLLYRVGETECTDENTGENSKPIQVRPHQFAADVRAGGPLPTWRCFPCCGSSAPSADDVGLPKEDPEYVPACLVLSGSPILREMVRDLVSQVEASRKNWSCNSPAAGSAWKTCAACNSSS